MPGRAWGLEERLEEERCGAVRSMKRKLSREDEENGGREEGDKRNVESKKQKGRRNKSTARELGGDDRDGKRRDTAN